MFKCSTKSREGAVGTKLGRFPIGTVLAAMLSVTLACPAAFGKGAALRLMVKDQKAGTGVEGAGPHREIGGRGRSGVER